MNGRTVAGWAAIAFVVWWVIMQPASAAHLIHNIGTFLSTAADRLSHWVATL